MVGNEGSESGGWARLEISMNREALVALNVSVEGDEREESGMNCWFLLG